MLPSALGLKKPASYIELATYAIGSACCNLWRASRSSYSICSMFANLAAVCCLCSSSRCFSSSICCLERRLLAAAFIRLLLLPLLTDRRQRMSKMSSLWIIPVLTTGRSASSKDPFNLWIHHDANLSFVLYPPISCVDLLSDPVLEFLADNSSYHISYLCSRQF